MKKIPLLLLLASAITISNAQEIRQDLKHFTKVIASPRVHVMLSKGEKESIRLVYNNVDASKINIDVRHKTLLIYLDKARKVERRKASADDYESEMMYEDASITAYITYKDLEGVEIRGNQELACLDAIESDKFRLKAYGENEITFASLKTEFFKASLFGQNDLKVNCGRVVEQKYKLFGENKIDTREMKSAFTTASIFGEGDLKINTSEEVRLDAFGEPSIHIHGGGHLNKRLIFGNTSIYQGF